VIQIGTIVLWIFWPSFNGALAISAGGGASAQRFHCVLNTVLSLLGACIATFIISGAVEGKLNMVRPQPSSLGCCTHCCAWESRRGPASERTRTQELMGQGKARARLLGLATTCVRDECHRYSALTHEVDTTVTDGARWIRLDK
jgi:hypothetical protein